MIRTALFCLVLPALAQQPITESGNVLPAAPVLIKSLGDAAEFLARWQPPASAGEWRQRRPVKDAAFRRALGLEPPPPRSPLNARILASHDLGDYTIENLVFESRPGFPVTANLYRSKTPAPGRHAAVLCPIGHYLSAGKAASDVQARCIKLARMGFIVLVYDAIGQGERLFPGNIHHDAGYALLPIGETIAGWMVWDSMRAIDYLLTRADVDPDRIGVTGNSGGGLNTLFIAAVDPRVRAATVVGFTFEFANWLKYAGTHCTCVHLPGVFRSMEWFEIGGLIAPRALLMLQGTEDGIFPISGARRASANTARIFEVLGQPSQVRFTELAGQPHAYSRPYREQMYGWMALHLLGQGDGGPIAEGPVEPLKEDDARLRCDPGRTFMPQAPTVIDLARKQAGALARRPPEEARRWVRELATPPEAMPHYLAAERHKEKVFFNSEDGERIPGLLWVPERPASPSRAVIVADARGKAAVDASGLVPPLLKAGFTVFAVDLRGRGETLGHYQPEYWTTNFRLVANQVLFGRPLAGRRAFDLRRAIDYLAPVRDVTLVGIGDDSLPVLLAAIADERVSRAAVAGWFHSFASQMRPRKPASNTRLDEAWNDPQLAGIIDTGEYPVDFGSVIPGALRVADVPDLVALISPRPVLFCNSLDRSGAVEPPLSPELLLEWISSGPRPPLSPRTCQRAR